MRIDEIKWPLTIDVTQERINQGCHMAWGCPVAEGVLDKLPREQFGVSVTPDYVRLFSRETGIDRRFKMPEQAKRWIVVYDSTRGAGVKPFTFELTGELAE